MLRLAVRVRREDAEIVLAELLELAPGGIEETERGDVVEYAVYGAPGELPALPDLRAAAGAALVDVSTSEVGDDWDVRWREFHRPVSVGGRLLLRAPWHEPVRGTAEVVIDPGQAFGTGAHPTTRLCLEALCELEAAEGAPADGRGASGRVDGGRASALGALVDVGCGSGVLAIAAARLGWDPILALDHEPQSVEATRANAAANGVELATRRFDLRAEPVPAAPTVLANLLRPLLLALRFAGDPPRRLIAGGLLAREADEVAAHFAGSGLRETRRLERDGWVALVLEGAGG